MTNHFNGLTEAELERLALIAEEASEVIKEVNKIIRHGYESYNPTIPNSPTNRQNLAREIGDILFIIDMAIDCGDINYKIVEDSIAIKSRNIREYLHHNLSV